MQHIFTGVLSLGGILEEQGDLFHGTAQRAERWDPGKATQCISDKLGLEPWSDFNRQCSFSRLVKLEAAWDLITL